MNDDRLPGAEPRALGLDRRIAEMRRVLAAMSATSDAVALKALRDRFPDLPLGIRVKALAEHRR